MRKFSDLRILATPSLSKLLCPTSIISNECRLLIMLSQPVTQPNARLAGEF
jgi:hypothetical protein